MTCRARQFSDQMVCNTCGLVWDMNDPERPACNMDSKGKLTGAAVDKRLSALRAILARTLVVDRPANAGQRGQAADDGVKC